MKAIHCVALLLLPLLLAGALRADTPAKGLTYTLSATGLASLNYQGWSFLGHSESGQPSLQSLTPRFRRADGTVYDGHQTPQNSQAKAVTIDTAHHKLLMTYAWGKMSFTYRKQADRLLITVGIHNTSRDTLLRADVALAELTFSQIPQATTYDVGMFGLSGYHPLCQYPVGAEQHEIPNIVSVTSDNGALDYCNENVTDPANVSFPNTSNPPTNTAYPLHVDFKTALAPGAGRTTTVSLRFGPHGTTGAALAQDLLVKYRAAYPFQVHWDDRRAIGYNVLSGSEAHPATNPRGWFNNAKDVDTTTPAGIAAFRTRLLAYADNSVTILKDMRAQGVITWDAEGEQYAGATYYGDPRLVGKLAPEMEYKDASGVATVDAYFRKFTAAGLRVGVCLRPHQITFVNGAPVQQDSPDPTKTLLSKIAYAKHRWGCTLFYIDSTVSAQGSPLDPDIIQKVAQTYPDVLLIPENQTTRYYAYSAPLDSFYHHGVAATPQIVRDVYPDAFTVLLSVSDGPGGTVDANHKKLVAAIRHGDIMTFQSWWNSADNHKLKSLYDEAGPWSPPHARPRRAASRKAQR